MRALNADETKLIATYHSASRTAVRYAIFAQSVRSRIHLFEIIVKAIDTADDRSVDGDEFAALMLSEIAKNRRVRGASEELARMFESFRVHAEQAIINNVQP